MRIGIDGACLSNRRGFGRFAREVVKALGASKSPHDFVVLVDRPSLEQLEIPPTMETVAVEVKQAPSRAASSGGRRGLGDMFAMGRSASRSDLDLIYFPASYSFFPVWNSGKVVVTMHDTLALAHPELVFSSWKGRLAWAAKERAAILWADRILTVSESARADLAAMFKLDPARIGVVPEAADSTFRPMNDPAESRIVLDRRNIDGTRPFLLYVGGLSPHKNLPRLIEAFALGAPPESDLVLVGDLKDVFLTHVPVLREAVVRHGLQSRVIFTGFVPDDELAHIYSRAYALAQPSLMEGFGLPPLEAMACGTPVLSSRAGSLPEVVAEGGEFFDPLDVPGMADAIRSLFADPARRDRLAASALSRAGRFTWQAAADALLACFESYRVPAQNPPGRAA